LLNRLSPRLSDLYANDLDGSSASDHPLGCRAREAGNAQIDQQGHWKAVREHDRLGAAVGGGREQFERATAVGLGARALAGGADSDKARGVVHESGDGN
jgi:hypothetical protein